MYGSARRKLAHSDANEMGLNLELLLAAIQEREEAALNGESYEDMQLSLHGALLEHCRNECDKLGLLWGAASQMDNEGLIHRHTLRDRTPVIAAREQAKQERAQGRSQNL